MRIYCIVFLASERESETEREESASERERERRESARSRARVHLGPCAERSEGVYTSVLTEASS